MNPEQARLLRDAIQHRSYRNRGLYHQAGAARTRQIHFVALTEQQSRQICILLEGIEGLTVLRLEANCLQISYDLARYTLAGLENALQNQGYPVQFKQPGFFRQLQRQLIHFWEETQVRNLSVPQRLLKKSNEAYVHAWEQHLHGDRDDTPPELREER